MQTDEVLTFPVQGNLISVNVNLVKLAAIAAESTKHAEALLVRNDEDEKKAVDFVLVMSDHRKAAEDERVRHVSPFNDFVKKVNALFKPLTTTIEEAETKVKAKVLAFRKEKAKRIDEENARREEEHQKALAKEEKKADKKGIEPKYIPPPLPVAPAENVTRGNLGGGLGSRKVWTAEIIEAKLIPIDYYLADNIQEEVLKTLKALAKASKGSMKVPGVRFFEEETMASVRR